MCSNCFDTNIDMFTNANHFDSFEEQLEQKLRTPNGLFYLRQSAPGELVAYSIYGCKSCEAKWYLNVPAGENSGCFMQGEKFLQVLDKINKKDSRWRTGIIFVCVMIMLICLLFLMQMLN